MKDGDISLRQEPAILTRQGLVHYFSRLTLFQLQFFLMKATMSNVVAKYH